jgi:hypothetical protein
MSLRSEIKLGLGTVVGGRIGKVAVLFEVEEHTHFSFSWLY